MNHFIGESFSYDDIEQVTNNPNVLYRLNVKDQYIISAVTIPPNDIKIIITTMSGDPVDIYGDKLYTSDPSVISLVSYSSDDIDHTIKSQMLSIADDLMYNITEEVSIPMSNRVWDSIKDKDPFNRGWSTNPQDVVDTLSETGYEVSPYRNGEDTIYFTDSDGDEHCILVNRVGQNTFTYKYDQEYEDVDADDLLDDDDLDEGTTESQFSREPYIFGIYGDDCGKYSSLDDLVKTLKSHGIKVTDLSGNEDYGWEFYAHGIAKDVFKLIDGMVPGYDVDDVMDFIDQYSIDPEDYEREHTDVTPQEKAYNNIPDREFESCDEDTVKKSNGKWTNKGKDGEHGEFDTKKQADAQRKAMFANGYRESMNEEAIQVKGYSKKDEYDEILQSHNDTDIYHMLQGLPVGSRLYYSEDPDESNWEEKTGENEWTSFRDNEASGNPVDDLHTSFVLSDTTGDWYVYLEDQDQIEEKEAFKESHDHTVDTGSLEITCDGDQVSVWVKSLDTLYIKEFTSPFKAEDEYFSLTAAFDRPQTSDEFVADFLDDHGYIGGPYFGDED